MSRWQSCRIEKNQTETEWFTNTQCNDPFSDAFSFQRVNSPKDLNPDSLERSLREKVGTFVRQWFTSVLRAEIKDAIRYWSSYKGIAKLAMGTFPVNNKLVIKAQSRHNTVKYHTDYLVQDCSISIANALEILQSCTKPAIQCCIGHGNDNGRTKDRWFRALIFFNQLE